LNSLKCQHNIKKIIKPGFGLGIIFSDEYFVRMQLGPFGWKIMRKPETMIEARKQCTRRFEKTNKENRQIK